MRPNDKPKSSRQTLEELKAQIENARPVVVDNSGRLYAPTQNPPLPPQQTGQYGPQGGYPPNGQQGGYPPQGQPPQLPQPPHQYDTQVPQGLRVKPSRWF